MEILWFGSGILGGYFWFKKGRNKALGVLMALFFGPITLIAAFVVDDKTEEENNDVVGQCQLGWKREL